jgi:hypothetical protein
MTAPGTTPRGAEQAGPPAARRSWAGASLAPSALVATLLLLAGVAIAACAARPATPQWQAMQSRKNEITALWTQIRDWRREAKMGVDPSPTTVFAMSGQSVRAVDRSCPDSHAVPAVCGDVCNLADAICDNAESICSIAAELGGDPWADGKCDNAKASCKEARKRCCDCAGSSP